MKFYKNVPSCTYFVSPLFFSTNHHHHHHLNIKFHTLTQNLATRFKNSTVCPWILTLTTYNNRYRYLDRLSHWHLPVFSFQVRIRDLAGSSHKYDGTRIYTTTVLHFPTSFMFYVLRYIYIVKKGTDGGVNIYTTTVHFSHFFYVLWPSVHIHCNEGVISIQPPYTFPTYFMFYDLRYIYVLMKG